MNNKIKNKVFIKNNKNKNVNKVDPEHIDNRLSTELSTVSTKIIFEEKRHKYYKDSKHKNKY